MSEIVIRHAEPKDYDAIRQIHAQPEVYHNTLQVPHPSMEMWQERLTERVGIKQLVACIDDIVVGHLCIEVAQRRAAAMWPILVSALMPAGRIAALPARFSVR
jgi:putative acetyltransferase